MSFGTFGTQNFGNTVKGKETAIEGSENRDIDITATSGLTDSISSLAFAPNADYLSVGSWDNNVRIYEINASGGVPKASYTHQGPVLCTTWSADGSKIFSGGADKAARMFDVVTGQSSQVGEHGDTIKEIKYAEIAGAGGVLITGSWDKTVKYWDTRQSTPIASVDMPDRVYAMDIAPPLLVVGTAERHIMVFDLKNPTQPYKQLQSSLKYQTRTIGCFPDSTGYAIGSIEGRVGIQVLDDEKNSFSFKCHRTEGGAGKTVPRNTQIVYPVNAITFNKAQGTFSTAGSDGVIYFWDKDSRSRLKTFENRGGPVVASAFNNSASLYAYAVSYDWHQGHTGNIPAVPNKVMVHACLEDEIKKRPAKDNRS